MAKTNAENCRAYYMRKKQKQLQEKSLAPKSKKKPKISNAESCRKYRARKRHMKILEQDMKVDKKAGEMLEQEIKVDKKADEMLEQEMKVDKKSGDELIFNLVDQLPEQEERNKTEDIQDNIKQEKIENQIHKFDIDIKVEKCETIPIIQNPIQQDSILKTQIAPRSPGPIVIITKQKKKDSGSSPTTKFENIQQQRIGNESIQENNIKLKCEPGTSDSDSGDERRFPYDVPFCPQEVCDIVFGGQDDHNQAPLNGKTIISVRAINAIERRRERQKRYRERKREVIRERNRNYYTQNRQNAQTTINDAGVDNIEAVSDDEISNNQLPTMSDPDFDECLPRAAGHPSATNVYCAMNSSETDSSKCESQAMHRAKTSTERSRKYRERKKLAKAHEKKKAPKTSAQRCKEYRERQKRKANESNTDSQQSSNIRTSTLRVKQFRERARLKKLFSIASSSYIPSVNNEIECSSELQQSDREGSREVISEYNQNYYSQNSQDVQTTESDAGFDNIEAITDEEISNIRIERRRERQKRYRERNRELIRERNRNYYSQNRQNAQTTVSDAGFDSIETVTDDDILHNREVDKKNLRKEHDRKYRQEHRETLKQRHKDYRQRKKNAQSQEEGEGLPLSDPMERFENPQLNTNAEEVPNPDIEEPSTYDAHSIDNRDKSANNFSMEDFGHASSMTEYKIMRLEPELVHGNMVINKQMITPKWSRPVVFISKVKKQNGGSSLLARDNFTIQEPSKSLLIDQMSDSIVIKQNAIETKTGVGEEIVPFNNKDPKNKDSEHIHTTEINIKVENECNDQFETAEAFPFEVPITNITQIKKESVE